MQIKEYLSKMKTIDEKLLNFLDQESDEEENYKNFITIINDQNFIKNRYDLKIILYSINIISNNHHRMMHFIDKIEQILITMKEKIQQFFSNEEIFQIFHTNKRILLFLIEEKILTIDQSIYKQIMTTEYKQMQYPEYFSFEIKSFIESKFKNKQESDQNEKNINKSHYPKEIQDILKEDYEKFNEKRKKGENDGYLYQIIQNDLIEEFIIYVNKESYPLDSSVERSIFETNEFLLKEKKTKLIGYAAFFGSTQIFKYLYKNGVKMTPKLWLYAIHGCDEEIVHILDENNIKLKEDEGYVSYKKCIKESIKCHHNDVANYFLGNYIQNEKEIHIDIFSYNLEYYNFSYFDIRKIYYKILFTYACKYDYFRIVEFFF